MESITSICCCWLIHNRTVHLNRRIGEKNTRIYKHHGQILNTHLRFKQNGKTFIYLNQPEMWLKSPWALLLISTPSNIFVYIGYILAIKKIKNKKTWASRSLLTLSRTTNVVWIKSFRFPVVLNDLWVTVFAVCMNERGSAFHSQ